MTPISQTFAALKQQGRMAFMPFITAGDPHLDGTQRLISELAARKVDLIEVGFPYSDPIADGPVIQASYTRALARGIQVRQIFAAIRQVSQAANLPPLVAMVSYAIILRIGPPQFVEQARQAGFSGLIVPDLPADEAVELGPCVRSAGLDLVQLIAPTTTPERTRKILETASGFVYCISVAGITGERAELPAELTRQLQSLRKQTDLPLAVGFGISRPQQVAGLRGLADGIIVGSAIVRLAAAVEQQGLPLEIALQNVGQLAAEMVAACEK